jgi:preprotein translocase subunit SecY
LQTPQLDLIDLASTLREDIVNLAQAPYQAEPDPNEEKTILILKIVFIFVIFGIALFFGVLPAKVKRCGRNPKFMSMANAFSGGLFLAIALVHILPDVVKDYGEYVEA